LIFEWRSFWNLDRFSRFADGFLRSGIAKSEGQDQLWQTTFFWEKVRMSLRFAMFLIKVMKMLGALAAF